MNEENINKKQKIRSILERSSNIDVQTLQKYIDKKLTKEELHEVEKQLLNSDFAAEAIEGFENADFKVNIAATTYALNKAIKKYNVERGFYKTDYRIFYAAASVALIFVVIFGLFRVASINFSSNDLATQTQSEPIINTNATTENQNLALNEEVQFDKEIEEKLIDKLEKEQLVEENKSNTKTEQNLALNKERKQDEKDFSTSDIWITKKEQVQSENNQLSNSTNSGQVMASSPIASRKANSDSVSVVNLEQLADDDYNLFSEDDTYKNEKSSKEVLFDAIQFYENRKYTEAIILLDTYLITNPDDAQALFFGGMSYYQNNNYREVNLIIRKIFEAKINYCLSKKQSRGRMVFG